MLNTPPLSNLQTRDIDSVLHPYTPLHKLKAMGPLVISHGKGVYVYDTQGRGYIEGMSGLWCAGLGFGDEELIDAATEQLRVAALLPPVRRKGHRVRPSSLPKSSRRSRQCRSRRCSSPHPARRPTTPR